MDYPDDNTNLYHSAMDIEDYDIYSDSDYDIRSDSDMSQDSDIEAFDTLYNRRDAMIEHGHGGPFTDPDDHPAPRDTRSYYQSTYSDEYSEEAEVEVSSPESDGESPAAFHPVGVHIEHQPRTCPTRALPIVPKRFEPHRPHSAGAIDGAYAEAGPPGEFLPPSGDLPLGPSKTADAEQNGKITEEDKAQSQSVEKTRSKRPPRKSRLRAQADATKLIKWAQNLRKSFRPMSLNEALDIALTLVETAVVIVNEKPILFVSKVATSKSSSKPGEKERNRRETERELLMKLSRYFQPETRRQWTRPKLLARVVEEVHKLEPCPNKLG